MKAIIFDIDNTLITWYDYFIEPLKNILKDMGYNNEELLININNCLDNHHLYFDKLTKQNMLDYINKSNNINLPITFIDRLIEDQKSLYYQDSDVNNTLEYLSKKYDLYIMTDWFLETQIARLNNMGILKYFKKIYAADNNYYKKNLKAYDVILNKYDQKECIFIGDDLEIDVKIPIKLGFQAIWKTNNKSNTYKVIKNIKELMNIL